MMKRSGTSFRCATPILAVCLCFFLLCPQAWGAAASDNKPGALIIRTVAELFQNPNRNTRLGAYFLSVGLPDRIEHTQILRQRLASADPLERIVILYALAGMTRASQDVDAFLEAFPEKTELFFELMQAEWKLSATFNTGMADFLLALAYEPRTREKALPHLGRIVVNTPTEFMNTYYKDPLSGKYIENNVEKLLLDIESYPIEPDYKKYDEIENTLYYSIYFITKTTDMKSKITAFLMIRRLSRDIELDFQLEIQLKNIPDPIYIILAEFGLDFTEFVKELPHDKERVVKMLRTEKHLYKPPLAGITGALWQIAQPTPDAETRKAIKAVWSYGKTYLDACEIQRFQTLSNQ